MSDNPRITGNQDRSRINTSQEHELGYWTEKFNVSKERLEEAVKAVGTRVEDVERYLRG